MSNMVLAATVAAAAQMVAAGGVAPQAGESARDDKQQAQEIKALAPKEFVEEAKENPQAVVIDVRTPQEYAQGHLAGAKNINWLDEKAFAEGVARLPKDKTYLLYCRSGHRSYEAAVKMQQQGYKVADMTGGILNYEAQGLPVVKK